MGPSFQSSDSETQRGVNVTFCGIVDQEMVFWRLFFQVDDLKGKLAAQEEELAIKNEDANKLIAVVGAEQEKVSKEKAIANEEQKKVAVIAEDVGQKQKVCSIELAKAEPALLAAKAALDTLNKVTSKLTYWIRSKIFRMIFFIFDEIFGRVGHVSRNSRLDFGDKPGYGRFPGFLDVDHNPDRGYFKKNS